MSLTKVVSGKSVGSKAVQKTEKLTLKDGRTLTRADLAEAVVRRVGLPRNESQKLVEMVLDTICLSLETGDQVKLSSFGSFGIREKAQRIGRNPKTGEEVPITPRRVLVFRASNIMKDRINRGLGKRSKKAK